MTELERFELIKQLARKRGYSLTKLNDQAGLGTNSIYHWKNTTPSTDSLAKVAKVLGVSVSYLLGEDDTPEWATEKDTHDLEEFLEQNEGSMTYGGEKLTEEDKEKLKIAMTQIFWRRHKHN